mgnify:CR=1 FL=1
MFQVIDMHCDTIPALQWKEKQERLADNFREKDAASDQSG